MPIDPSWEDAVLEIYPVVGQLSEAWRSELRAHGRPVSAAAGAVIFEPADFCRHFPLLIAGTARVLKVGSSTPNTLLYRLRPGDFCLLSSAGLLARWRFGGRVVAETDLRAVLLPGTLFRAMVHDARAFSHAVYVAIARRLEIVLDLVEQATHLRLDRRVAALLVAAGGALSASHRDLADDLGASRENVSRVLESFGARGWVTLGRRQIDVLDLSALEDFLDEPD